MVWRVKVKGDGAPCQLTNQMTGFWIVVISSQKVISCLPHCKATREAARPIVHHFTSAYTRRMPNINVKHPTNYVRTRPLAWYFRLRCTQRRSIVLLRYSVIGVGFLLRCSIPAIQQSLHSRSALIWCDDLLCLVMVLWFVIFFCSAVVRARARSGEEWGVVVALKIDAIWYHRNAYMCRIIRQ